MALQSINDLQNWLAEGVFGRTKDKRKAAGRALGTIVELITFYMLRQWGYLPSLSIERRLPEFGNQEITHNVEFGLHPILDSATFLISKGKLKNNCLVNKTSIRKIEGLLARFTGHTQWRGETLLSTDGLQRNAAVLSEGSDQLLVANIVGETDSDYQILLTLLGASPFAMAECKRVGIEEGARKGPTTIEKAKQGAYVATHVSALQKVRSYDGKLYGVLAKPDGTFEICPWKEELKRLVHKAPPEELDGFVLTIGVASDHGNWFTNENANKELKVLMQSYDWLLFLTDKGIVQFMAETILSNDPRFVNVRKAFQDSYGTPETGVYKSGKNRMTKVKIERSAHLALEGYFSERIEDIESSFNVLSPAGEPIQQLKDELDALRVRKWK